MTSLQKIRNHGALLIAIVGLAMLAFILGDFLNSGSSFFNRSRGHVDLDQLQERINEDGADVVVAGQHAAQEAQEHFGGGHVIIVHVHETDRAVDLVHVAVVLIQEHNVAGSGLGDVIGHIDEPLGLAGALVACDDLNHWKRLLQ